MLNFLMIKSPLLPRSWNDSSRITGWGMKFTNFQNLRFDRIYFGSLNDLFQIEVQFGIYII